MKNTKIECPVQHENEHKILNLLASELNEDEKLSSIKNNEHIATYYGNFIYQASLNRDYLCIVTEYCPV
jgi:hypothetical protein